VADRREAGVVRINTFSISPPFRKGGVADRREAGVVRINNMVQRSNRKHLKPYRKELRNASTSAEAELWNHLKGKQLEGRKFRRQHSIKKYIVDFYCSTEKLIIELDGESHGDYQKIYEDEDRDNDLRRMGYRILRFENRFIFEDIEWVMDEIRRNFNS
jgi:very-short-patch-repair endonuclease